MRGNPVQQYLNEAPQTLRDLYEGLDVPFSGVKGCVRRRSLGSVSLMGESVDRTCLSGW